MTETLVVAAINILLAIASGIFIKITNKRADAKTSIIRAFRKIYIEFGNIVAAGLPAGFPDSDLIESGVIPDFNVQGVEKAAQNIQKLHWKSILDIIKLNRIEWILKRAMYTIFIMAIIAIVSNIIGNFMINEEGNIKTALRFCFPGILVFCEVIFVIWMANTGSYLKSVINTYDNFEF